MKIKLGAVIPTVQYGNIQPEFEYDTDDMEWAMADAERRIQDLWTRYADKPLVTKTTGNRKLLKAFVGGEIYYDEAAHVYTNEAGEVYLSGSQYAKQFEKPFDGKAISEKMATKYGVSATDIAAMWELKARTSREFGTAMHSALQLYGQYNGLATALEKTTHIHDHPIIKKAVQSFYDGRESEKAEYEAPVVDHTEKHAGQIDRLLVSGDKRCRVQDFKTNADLTPDKLTNYWKQLEFYASILKTAGWTVEGLDIFHWDGEWKEHHK